MIYSVFPNQPVCPLPEAAFVDVLKHLPSSERKKCEKRHRAFKNLEKEITFQKELALSQVLDEETIFRFSYVPFVIAALAWDYADTIISIAARLKIYEANALSRAVRELKREYDNMRKNFIDVPHCKSEEHNMYVFEDGVNDLTNLFLSNIEWDIKEEYPELETEYLLYLKAVYQCHLVLQSIYKYVDVKTRDVEKIVGKEVGDILPSSLRRLDSIVLAFVGDKPVSEKFERQLQSYAKSLVGRMLEIEFTDEKDEQNG